MSETGKTLSEAMTAFAESYRREVTKRMTVFSRDFNRRMRKIQFGGRQPCCGATNRPCSRPPGVVQDYGTGCESCGHPASCHAYEWATR